MTYRKITEIMLVIAIILSNLSQIPALFGNFGNQTLDIRFHGW